MYCCGRIDVLGVQMKVWNCKKKIRIQVLMRSEEIEFYFSIPFCSFRLKTNKASFLFDRFLIMWAEEFLNSFLSWFLHIHFKFYLFFYWDFTTEFVRYTLLNCRNFLKFLQTLFSLVVFELICLEDDFQFLLWMKLSKLWLLFWALNLIKTWSESLLISKIMQHWQINLHILSLEASAIQDFSCTFSSFLKMMNIFSFPGGNHHENLCLTHWVYCCSAASVSSRSIMAAS